MIGFVLGAVAGWNKLKMMMHGYITASEVVLTVNLSGNLMDYKYSVVKSVIEMYEYHLYACGSCGFNTIKPYTQYDQDFKCPACDDSSIEIFPTNNPEKLKRELRLT